MTQNTRLNEGDTVRVEGSPGTFTVLNVHPQGTTASVRHVDGGEGNVETSRIEPARFKVTRELGAVARAFDTRQEAEAIAASQSKARWGDRLVLDATDTVVARYRNGRKVRKARLS